MNYCNDANSVAIRSYSDSFITNYVHVNPLPGFKAGDPINKGQQIDTVDMSGDSCGPHVHLVIMDKYGNPTCNWIFEITMIPAPPWFLG
ncbi:peptidoglycan DD-metalloendopeptidase family protein [Bacillus cereus]|uniref:peptidoglycan DD-metalloendopeptidase family protein n=1 Tax=Bacillus cereus TaxID=1396 RepID=UPI00356D5E93